MLDLLEFSIFGKSHTVERLPVHLPYDQPVYFEHGKEAEAVRGAQSRFQVNGVVEICTVKYNYILHGTPNHCSFVCSFINTGGTVLFANAIITCARCN